MSVLLNMFLAIDLILMIKYPFKMKEKRVRAYLVVSAIISASYTAVYHKTISFNDNVNYCVTGSINFVWMGLMIAIYIIVSLVSIAYALKKMTKSWISKESQRLVLGRHILSLLGSFLAYAYLVQSYKYTLFQNNSGL